MSKDNSKSIYKKSDSAFLRGLISKGYSRKRAEEIEKNKKNGRR